jgi:hypothetical protein
LTSDDRKPLVMTSSSCALALIFVGTVGRHRAQEACVASISAGFE